MGEMIDDETDTKAWGEIVLPPLSWTFPSPFLPPPIYDPDFSSPEGGTVMDRSHSPLHTPPPPLRFVLESNSTQPL